ncbi:hypothetical protein VPHD292_0074 [Vibrio phage D292]
MSRLTLLMNPPEIKGISCLLSYASLRHFTQSQYSISNQLDQLGCPIDACTTCVMWVEGKNIRKKLNVPNSHNGP